jgi:ATP-dependent Clp protease ATP-binding subunit ClpA/CheY-like chemotaxis protein
MSEAEHPSTKSTKKIIGAGSILDLLAEKVVGQQSALNGIASTVKTFQAGLAPIGRPAGIFLLLGPTGTGKTRTVEALAEILHGSAHKVVKIDCGEFQTDHEVAKLIGAPPGYLGHRETHPLLTQERLQEAASDLCDLSIVLFDEIEKAAPAVTRLLLGVLDKAKLRLGDNREVDFEKCLIFLTSNLGAREMMKELQPALGFRAANPADSIDLTRKLESIALHAVRRMYSPEFVNRIDAVITYQPLDSEALALILEQQVSDLQNHVNSRLGDKCFNIEVNEESRRFLLEKGTSAEYGARELKRCIHKYLTQPLATLVMENKVVAGSTVKSSLSDTKDALTFELSADRPTSPSRPSILIVDDNRDFLRLLSLELTEMTNWRVITSQSVSEAEAIAGGGAIDFALLDLLLPDGNGIELGAKLREKYPSVYVAIMTGAELSTAEEADCSQYQFDIVTKPFLPQQIVSLLQEKVTHLRRATA